MNISSINSDTQTRRHQIYICVHQPWCARHVQPLRAHINPFRRHNTDIARRVRQHLRLTQRVVERDHIAIECELKQMTATHVDRQHVHFIIVPSEIQLHKCFPLRQCSPITTTVQRQLKITIRIHHYQCIIMRMAGATRMIEECETGILMCLCTKLNVERILNPDILVAIVPIGVRHHRHIVLRAILKRVNCTVVRKRKLAIDHGPCIQRSI
mmetsp:Transcript_52964/g.87745  ORF Transcript_52964/g.87745 Transcript_52964/m.87745 type:complete len:212 (+) Transcript_52964:1210-1845(+)